MVPTEVFPPFIAQCPENNGCSVHVARWQRRQHRVQERSIFTMWPCSGRRPSFCFSSHHSKEKFGSKYSPGPCSFDILCCDAVSGFNKSTKTSSWMQEFPSTQRGSLFSRWPPLQEYTETPHPFAFWLPLSLPKLLKIAKILS